MAVAKSTLNLLFKGFAFLTRARVVCDPLPKRDNPFENGLNYAVQCPQIVTERLLGEEMLLCFVLGNSIDSTLDN